MPNPCTFHLFAALRAGCSICKLYRLRRNCTTDALQSISLRAYRKYCSSDLRRLPRFTCHRADFALSLPARDRHSLRQAQGRLCPLPLIVILIVLILTPTGKGTTFSRADSDFILRKRSRS